MLAYAGIEAASDLAPDIEVGRRDLKRIAVLGAIAVPLVYAGMAAIALMAVPVVADPARPETALGDRVHPGPRSSASSPPSTRTGSRRSCSGRSSLVAAPVLFWVGDDLDARRLPARLRAGDQPPDPELAGQARAPPRDAVRGDHDLRADRGRPRAARPNIKVLARPLRLRGDAGDHDRPPLDHPPAGDDARREAALPHPLGDGLGHGGAADPGDDRGGRQRRSPSSACSPSTRPPAGSGSAGWPSASPSTSSTARSSRGPR